MVAIRKLFLLLIFLISAMQVNAEGTYELRGKTSANDEVRIDGRRDGFNGFNSFGLQRVTIFYVDIKDAQNEVIDLYTSNPSQSDDNRDIAVWCPSNKPSFPEGASAHQSADRVYNVRPNKSGYIGSWSDVISVQNINTRVRKPKTFNPRNEGCGEGVYTVRFYTAGTSSDTFANALRYMDIGVRDRQVNALRRGRVFSDHYSLIVDGFGSELNFKVYAVEGEDFFDYYEGYVWEIDANGIQPFGFQLIANNTGVNPSTYNDKSVPINLNPTPILEKQYNIYLNYPDKQVRLPSGRPNITNFNFNSICPLTPDPSGNTTGGYFTFNSSGIWKYKLYIDLDGDNEVNLNEKVFSGNSNIGFNQIYWDGILPNGQEVPEGTEIKFNLYLSDGEIHFPWVDVENQRFDAGPIIELVNSNTTDSRYYYWDDTPLSANATTSIDGSLGRHTWASNLGNNAVIDTWKYAYNDGLRTSLIYKNDCQINTGEISGFVFDDLNFNSVKDGGESGIENVTVVLHNLDENTCSSKKTSSTGSYLFDQLPEANYNIIESATESVPIPSTCPSQESDLPNYISVNDNIISVVLGSVNLSNKNFADFNGFKINGKTFIDNGLGSNNAHNGIQDGSENNYPNVKIEVLSSGSLIQNKHTDASGEFEFWIRNNTPNITIKSENKNDFKNVSANEGNTGGTVSSNFKEIVINNASGKTSGITFGYVQDPTIVANQSKTIQAGTNTNYTHIYKVNTIGNVTFTIENEQKSPANLGVNAILYNDVNCNGVIDANIDTQNITNISVNVNSNDEICLIVKVIAPSNAPNNSNYNFDIEAETNYTNIPIVVSKSIQNVTIITNAGTNSNLVLIKSVDKSNALPNEVISYTLTARNTGIDILNSIVINDFTPDFTNFESATCPTVLPINIVSCTVDQSPNVGEKGAVRWIFVGDLNSSEELVVFYQVRVDN